MHSVKPGDVVVRAGKPSPRGRIISIHKPLIQYRPSDREFKATVQWEAMVNGGQRCSGSRAMTTTLALSSLRLPDGRQEALTPSEYIVACSGCRRRLKVVVGAPELCAHCEEEHHAQR